jgi:methylated-DNA-protein-cysteine methyltransferase-like protein
LVATYGQIAQLAGIPRGARQVGYALHRAPPDVPWQRVINARGEVSPRSAEGAGAEHEQRFLLEQEGVVFDLSGRVDLARFRWKPK